MVGLDLSESPLFQILQKVYLEDESPELFKVDMIDLKAAQPTHDPHEVLKIYHQMMLQPESEVVAEDAMPPPPSRTEGTKRCAKNSMRLSQCNKMLVVMKLLKRQLKFPRSLMSKWQNPRRKRRRRRKLKSNLLHNLLLEILLLLLNHLVSLL